MNLVLRLKMMIVLFVGCSLVAGTTLAMGQTATPALANGCGNKNAFLVNLHRSNVTIFATPQASTEFCNGEWNVFGTCCETSSLKEYAKRDMGNIGGFLDRMESENKHLREAVVLLIDVLASVSDQIQKSAITNVSTTILDSIKQSVPSWKIKMQEYLGFMRDIERKFKHVQTKCAIEMNSLRSSSICTTCSGRSELFFFKGKILIDQPTCHLFVDKCYDAWTMLIQIMNGMKRGRDIVDKLRPIRPYLQFGYKAPALEKIQNWIEETLLAKSVRECHRRGDRCSDRTEKVICENVLNLNKATFLEDTVGLLLEAKSSDKSKEFKNFVTTRKKYRAKKEKQRDRKEQKASHDRKVSNQDERSTEANRGKQGKAVRGESAWTVESARPNIQADNKEKSATTSDSGRTVVQNNKQNKPQSDERKDTKNRVRSDLPPKSPSVSRTPSSAQLPTRAATTPKPPVNNSIRKLLSTNLPLLPAYLSEFGYQTTLSPLSNDTISNQMQTRNDSIAGVNSSNLSSGSNASENSNLTNSSQNNQTNSTSTPENPLHQTNATGWNQLGNDWQAPQQKTNDSQPTLTAAPVQQVLTVIPFAESGQYLSDTTVVCTFNRDSAEFKDKELMDPKVQFLL